jgi:hypothetical protein
VCIDGGRYRPQTSEWGSSCGFDGGVGGQNKGCYQLNVNINSLEVDNAGACSSPTLSYTAGYLRQVHRRAVTTSMI